MTNEDDEKHRRFIEGWVRFKREVHASEVERDADPIRKARSTAWRNASKRPGVTSERLIASANAAEIEERKRLGITEPMDVTRLATDDPHPFPSDARSIEHLPADIRAVANAPLMEMVEASESQHEESTIDATQLTPKLPTGDSE